MHDLEQYRAENTYNLLVSAEFLEQSDGVAITKGLAQLYKKEGADGAVTMDQVLELAKRTVGEEWKQCHTHTHTPAVGLTQRVWGGSMSLGWAGAAQRA